MTYSILEDEIRKALYFMVMVYSKKNLPLSELYRLDMEAMQRIATVDSIIRMTEPMFHGIKECEEMFRAFDRAKTEYDKIHWDIRQQIIEKLDK